MKIRNRISLQEGDALFGVTSCMYATWMFAAYLFAACVFATGPLAAKACAQSVCLPSPRLLTTMPMGGQVGTEFDVVVTGESLEGTEQLIFSNPAITATPKLNEDAGVVAGAFVVRIDEGCAEGVYDARIMAALGISSARAFSVGTLPEVQTQTKCTTVETAAEVEIGSIVNGVLVDRSINHYAIQGRRGQRIVVDCAAKGIDSKMNPVVAIADAAGSDLLVERRGGQVDFEIPEDGRYLIKVHDLTFKGGAHYFYRLGIQDEGVDSVPPPLPRTHSVASYSWPAVGLAETAEATELEPNDDVGGSQVIHLPCDIAGQFYPAADVDSFEFQGKKGEVWWIEVASERLGLATDPSVVIQRIVDGENPVDVTMFSDIPSPVKRSSNGYSYDGPPYNAGSSDLNGRIEIPEDGTYRIRLTDLFGGTRSDPDNRYRMIVRKGRPDYALVGWALHMGLRNGDRNALSKPIALRGGAVMPLEIVVMRRDGFDGEIELTMENLPEGVRATGLKIAKGETRGILLISAEPNAPRGLQMARLTGSATIDGQNVVRECRLASMKWPVTNARSEIPDPRLVDSIPVSVGGVEQAGLSIEAVQDKVWEAPVGGTLSIDLKLTRRGEFSGKTLSLQTFGPGLERATKFDVSLVDDRSTATIDLGRLKTPPGEYTVAFYGGAVAKYPFGAPKPKDIVDIYVSEPIRVRVNAAEAEAK